MDTQSLQHNKKRILIIEDDLTIQNMLARLLEGCGYEVFQVEGGDQGFVQTLDLKPDLILLDLNLPGMMGTVVCEKVRADTRVKNIPILMMTGVFKKIEDKVKGFNLGADDYIIKPFDLGVLTARIRSILKTQRMDAFL